MSGLPEFPNTERLIDAALNALGADHDPPFTSGGVTPADLQERAAFIRLRRAGGQSDVVNDYSFLVVEVTAATYAIAEDVAEATRRHLTAGPISNVHGLMDRAVCASAHTEIPADDATLRRITTTYRLTCRRLPSSA